MDSTANDSSKGTTMTEDGTGYIMNHQITHLFQNLMIGLMHTKPAEPIDFLMTCLVQVKHMITTTDCTLDDAYSWKKFVPRKVRRTAKPSHVRGAMSRDVSPLPPLTDKSNTTLSQLRKQRSTITMGINDRVSSLPRISGETSTSPAAREEQVTKKEQQKAWHAQAASLAATSANPTSSAVTTKEQQKKAWHAQATSLAAASANPTSSAVTTKEQQKKASPAAASDPNPMVVADIKKPLVVCGPSGAGKSTLVKMLMAEFPGMYELSVSHTSRSPRDGEEHGVHYNFVSKDTMQQIIAEGNMVEYAEVHGNLYGTSRTAIETASNKGAVCVLDVDTQGVRSLKASNIQPSPLYVFVKPTSIDTIRSRLEARGTETSESIETRLSNAKLELQYGEENDGANFDIVVVNDNLDKAYAEFKEAVHSQLHMIPSTNAISNRRPADNVVFVVGGPGSGKSTQCTKVIQHLDMEFHSVGDILRSEVQLGSERGRMIEATMAAGELVSMEIIIEAIKPVIEAVPHNRGLLLDGFPRALDQHELFERTIGKARGMLWFELDQSTMEERLLKRAEGSGRVDDTADVIRKRFQIFNEQSRPVLDTLQSTGRAHVVDASHDIDTVFQHTLEKLNALGFTTRDKSTLATKTNTDN